MATPLSPWVIACGGFHQHGGMDRANYALAQKLIEQGRRVYLVAHHVASELALHPSVTAKLVPRPLSSILLGERALRHAGLQVAQEVTQRWPGARVVVNGGNCTWPDINWIHSVHSCWPRFDNGAPMWFRAKSAVNKWKACRDESEALEVAKLLIANSQRTARDLQSMGVPEIRIRTLYLGSSPEWVPADTEETLRTRKLFDLPPDAKVIAFVGALGYDRNKGFDTLLTAFQKLTSSNAYLLAAGGGRGLESWRSLVRKSSLADKIRLIGFTERVADVFSACDLLVSPVRYEAFGLNVQEAICRGVPAIVSASAGVAELYPDELQSYLLHDPEDNQTLGEMIRRWYSDPQAARKSFEPFSSALRRRTWGDMAEEIVSLAETGSVWSAASPGRT